MFTSTALSMISSSRLISANLKWKLNVAVSTMRRMVFFVGTSFIIVGGSDSILESEVFDLYKIFKSTIDRLVHDMDKLKIYKEQMKDFFNKAKTDVPMLPKLNSKDVFSAMLGVKEPTSKTIRNPDENSNKGTGVHSRWKSKAEIEKEAAQNSEKRRTCSKCRNKEGHNSRICTNERVQPSNKVKKTVLATSTRTGLRARRN
ncbi:hypothetical protein Tco_0384901 [Tanacetum coccineum]